MSADPTLALARRLGFVARPTVEDDLPRGMCAHRSPMRGRGGRVAYGRRCRRWSMVVVGEDGYCREHAVLVRAAATGAKR